MTSRAISPQLTNALAKLTSSKRHAPLFIETGEACLDVVAMRLNQLTAKLKGTSRPVTQSPLLLVLLAQEYLADALAGDGSFTCSTFACLSEDQSPREDLSTLSATRSAVVVTTPVRTIDHLRRDNIDLSQTKDLVIVHAFKPGVDESALSLSDRSKEFLDDIQYILTKVDARASIEWYVEELSHLQRQPQELVAKPIVLAKADWATGGCPLELYRTSLPDDTLVLDVLHAAAARQGAVMCTPGQRTHVNATMERARPRLALRYLDPGDTATWKDLQQPSSGTVVVLYGLDIGDIITYVRWRQAWPAAGTRTLCIVSPEVEDAIKQSKETLLMNNETKSAPEQDEVVAGKIKLINAKILADSNPEELDALKKAIKKQVPLMRRGYFTAYLLREFLNGPVKNQNRERQADRPKRVKTEQDNTNPSASEPAQAPAHKEQGEGAEKPQHQSIAVPEGAKTIYLNIGKMKRLYAKELAQLLQTELSINREEIYSIRIHDKYSFITMPEAFAEQAIAKLNGMEIKGRVAAVSYSNKE